MRCYRHMFHLLSMSAVFAGCSSTIIPSQPDLSVIGSDLGAPVPDSAAPQAAPWKRSVRPHASRYRPVMSSSS